MICEKCGKETDYLQVDMFEGDGSDDWYNAEITEDHGVVLMNVLHSWTGDGLSEEEQTETIRCPHCKQYPFDRKWIDTCSYVNVIMYTRTA